MLTNHKNRLIAASVAGLLCVAGAFTVQHYAEAKPQAQSPAPSAVTVDVAEVHQRNVTEWKQYSGHLEAVEHVDVRPQVSGMLTAVHFKDGSLVRKGDLLFTIDPRPFEAEVARAQAQLAGAEARAAYTADDLARGQRLLADNAIARRDFDEKQNAAREARANLQAAQAALKTAQLNLEYTRITAPIAGRTSRAEVTVGNLVAPANSAALTTLVSADRIYAAFDVDEPSYLQVINAAQGKDLPIHLGLADSEDYPLTARLSSIDNHLDSTSGTIKLRAVLDNRNGRLVPGLYVRVKLGSSNQHKAILIDEKAIGTDQAKRFVLVVNPRGQTSYREVRLGSLQDGLRVVESGLAEGERIVVNGLQRVRPGDTVTPHPVQMGATEPDAKKI
ncbi:efflux RND transporter periplasmic adaptor subunit [Uliginosibacterium gangwonense]|uniref:efflux RND transporter periplasmic adaptor subunit n=1 Tax=Uliginosibacterium gangwonense TaxID=392736 RepID=UPI000380A417|nr:efflux RND transporter periplasmic adaptor subunit [Uliginosibacterium gangwonense]